MQKAVRLNFTKLATRQELHFRTGNENNDEICLCDHDKAPTPSNSVMSTIPRLREIQCAVGARGQRDHQPSLAFWILKALVSCKLLRGKAAAADARVQWSIASAYRCLQSPQYLPGNHQGLLHSQSSLRRPPLVTCTAAVPSDSRQLSAAAELLWVRLLKRCTSQGLPLHSTQVVRPAAWEGLAVPRHCHLERRSAKDKLSGLRMGWQCGCPYEPKEKSCAHRRRAWLFAALYLCPT